MAQNYINKASIKVGDSTTTYVVEPTLYSAASTSNSGATYTAALDNFGLITGATVQIKFTVTNQANATLNVNSTGAKTIYYNGAAITADILKANHTYTLSYDGTQWQLVGDIDTNTSATTLSGYGITDAKIETTTSNSVTTTNITLGNNTITPILNIAGLTGTEIGAADLRSSLKLSAALRFIGKVASDSSYTPSDGTTGNPTITGVNNYTPIVGDVVLDKDSDSEYVCVAVSGTTYTWELLGSDSSWAMASHTHGNISSTGTKISTYDGTNDAATTTSHLFLREDGKWAIPKYTTDNDYKVSQAISSTNNTYPIIFSSRTTANASNNTAYVVNRNNSMYVNPSTGTIYATTFNGAFAGDLTGNVTGNITGNVSGTAGSWASSVTVYTELSTSGTDSSIQGGESAAVALKVNGTLGTGNGGTGATSHTANRLVWSTSATAISAGNNHYADATHIGVNYTGSTPGYNLYVNGTSYVSDDASFGGDLIFTKTTGGNKFDWNNGTYRQRLTISDNSTANDEVFVFSQSTDSGSNYTPLLTIKDNNIVEATTFKGALDGNASTATSWATAQTVYVTLGTASTTTTIQGGSTSAETIGVDGTLNVGNGGTGKASWTQYGIVYASASNALSQITAGASTNQYWPLVSQGAAMPDWYGGIEFQGTAAANWITYFNGTTNSTSKSTGAVQLSGGLGVAKAISGEKYIVDDHVTLSWNSTDQSLDFTFA